MVDRAALQRLMCAAADGDRAALDPLFAALWPVLLGYATRWLGDRTLAEDAVQDALVRLFGQLDRFDRERDALTWALTHTTWQCRTSRRSRERRREDAGAETAMDGASLDGRHQIEQRALVRAALDALAGLEAHDREVIAAVLTDDDEVRRSITPTTFRKRLERALGRLRTSWRSRHGTL